MSQKIVPYRLKFAPRQWLDRDAQGKDAQSGADTPLASSMADIPPDPDLVLVATANQNGAALGPTTGGLAMATFLSGLDASGDLDFSDPNYWNWNSKDPPDRNFNFAGYAHVWTPGSTVTYWFNPASNWTVAEQGAFTQALNLWSAIADIHFSLSAAPTLPGHAISITRGSDSAASTSTPYSFSVPLGMGQISSASVSIDTSASVWSQLASFSASGGYGRETVLHELGHALGLGHSGPYNGSIKASQVMFTEDTRQYSVMSYVDAGSAIAATVAAKNGDTASPASYSNANGTFYLTTPGQYDILAIQRMYGVATNTPLTSGVTFGFNASASLVSALPMYDFTVNTNPVVTLYDTALGNALDLSGFSLASIVDLNPGQFSSVNGMTDNIGIAFNTWIDTAIGGGGNDTFYVNAHGNTIDGGGGSDTVVFAGLLSSYVLGHAAGKVTVNDGGIIDTLSQVETLQFADQTVSASSIACFAAGTRILTPSGEVAVESLREGDLVCTASGGTRPVRWIGWRRIDLLAHPHPPLAAPILVRRGAFGPGQPMRDLALSPDHAILAEGVLIPACLLVNGGSIVQRHDTPAVTYYHLELDRHDIVVAEGLAVESYLDTGNRAMFANAGLALILHPDCSVRYGVQRWAQDACAALVTEGAPLHAARRHLMERAIGDDCRMDADPGLHLAAGGRAIRPVSVEDDCHVFALPAGTRRVHVRSHSAVPVEVGAHLSDRRRLGVAIDRITLATDAGGSEIPVDHPALRHGWHDVESADGCMWRWTDGAALLPLPEAAGRGSLLRLKLHARLPAYLAPCRAAARLCA
ncbi:MAG: Hint domain-containing protein [Acetobacteraceae bacterium]